MEPPRRRTSSSAIAYHRLEGQADETFDIRPATPILSSRVEVAPFEELPDDEVEIDVADVGLLEKKGEASVTGTTFNLTNSIVGAGVLGLPSVNSKLGYVCGGALVIAMCCFACFSGHLMMVCLEKANVKSYSELGRAAFGRKGKIVIQIMLLLMNMGVLIAYLDIWADVCPQLLTYWFKWSVPLFQLRIYTLVFALLVVFPLSMLTRLNSLRFASIFAIACIFVLLTAIVVTGCVEIANDGGVGAPGFTATKAVNFSFFQSISMVAFSYNGHFAIPVLYQELKKGRKRKMERIINMSFVSSACVYLVAGVFGYLTFGDAIESNLLKNYNPGASTAMDVIKLVFGFSILLSFPLVCFTLRDQMELLFFRKRAFSWCRHVSETIFLIGTAFTVAVFVPDVSNVFGLTGALCTMSISYIVPMMVYLRMASGHWTRPKRLVCCALLLIATVIMLVASYIAVVDLIHALKKGQ